MRGWRQAAVIFALCAAPRLAFLIFSPPPELTYYWYLSGTLLRSGTFGPEGSPDTHVEPLYPLFLAAARWITGEHVRLAFAMQALIGSLGGVLLHRLAGSLLGSQRAAWIATALYAFDPYLVRQSAGNLETTLLTALLIAAALAARLRSTRGAVLTGALTAGAALTHFSMAPLILLVPIVLGRRSLRDGAACLFVGITLLTPWSLRGYRIDGAAVPSRVGLNLAVSLSDAGEQLLPAHNKDRLMPLLDRNGLKTDGELLAEALRSIREHPWRAVKLKLGNLLQIFNPRLLPYAHEPRSAQLRVEDGRYFIEGAVPRPLLHQWIHAVWRSTLLALAVVGVWMRRFRWDDGVLWAIVLTVVTVCALFVPTTRLTTPMVFAWMVFAARALDATRLADLRDARG